MSNSYLIINNVLRPRVMHGAKPLTPTARHMFLRAHNPCYGDGVIFLVVGRKLQGKFVERSNTKTRVPNTLPLSVFAPRVFGSLSEASCGGGCSPIALYQGNLVLDSVASGVIPTT